MTKYILSGFLDEASPDLTDQLAACRKNGVWHIEMRGVNGRPVVAQSAQETREIKKALDGEGVRISAVGSPFGKIGVNDPLEPHLEQFRRAMELCHILETDNLRLFSFYIPAGEDPARYRTQVEDRIDQMLRIAEDADIACSHENEKGIYGDVTERCLELYQTFLGRMGGIFDPANFIQCGVRPQEAYPVLAPYIRWLHVKDCLMESGRVVPAGFGDGHIADMLQYFSGRPVPMFLSLEPHLKVFRGLEALETDDASAQGMTGYPSGQAAFAAAADALKTVLGSIGYRETQNGQYEK